MRAALCIFDKTFSMRLIAILKTSLACGIMIILLSCSSKTKVDLIIHHAKIYTVDAAFSLAEAMAVKDGKVVALGKNETIMATYEAKEIIDAAGNAVFPGFIDAHTHFVNYGMSLQTLNLTGTNSWEDVLHQCSDFAKSLPEGEWLIGRGWDQNDWSKKEFPDNTTLNEMFPNRPVLLTRIDGHAIVANQKALDLAGLKPGTIVAGGEIIIKNGKLSGVLVDNATDLVYQKVPGAGPQQTLKALLNAQANCFAVGLTSVNECGLDYPMVKFIDSLQKKGELKMRVYAMLSDNKANYEAAFTYGKIKTERLQLNAFKVYADGALGSRGACLLKPYQDQPNWSGFLLSTAAHFDSVAQLLSQKGWQMCTHAIGDSGNRAILQVYAKYLKGKNDLRWRIEHAQVIDANDLHFFGDYNIIPSVQPTHATSDMYWAGERLGKERVKTAYAYKQLMDQNQWIPLGTDFPVEDISPFKTFFAAVARQDAKEYPAGGFQMNNALSRESAIRGMTIWAARASFEEKEKGSLEPGKMADFILLDTNLMDCPIRNVLNAKVLVCFVKGEKLYTADTFGPQGSKKP